ncbi:MAG: NUDIX domain-containing protein [Salipiger thiooxidans]|uniref:NUDIX domain-containing protein n=1 Tax=Salipiger thiooxidans TaxID=282683 RepID=UPI001CFA2225|nr:NUDIX hydrolase [Salipiger thiooxidans]
MTFPHRISAGALVVDQGRLLLLRHFHKGEYDFWAPPGGGVEGGEELEETARRETFEETGLRIETQQLAYIDELIDGSGRMVKFWFTARLLSGSMALSRNPDPRESTSDAGWFAREDLPEAHVFPAVLRGRFWHDWTRGFESVVRLPLKTSIF